MPASLVNARDVVASVSMPEILRALNIVCNERTRRAPCVIHSGSNPSAFAWRDSGLWHCHSCGRGGDKIALVRVVRGCSFRESLDFLASLAGVEYSPSRDSVQGTKAMRAALLRSAQMLREEAQREAKRLVEAEHVAWREARDSCYEFDWIRGAAIARLEAIRAGGQERFLGERQLAEIALRDADWADASYTVISFARLRDRFRYLRGGSEREAVVREALERGGVYTDAYEGRHFQGIVR